MVSMDIKQAIARRKSVRAFKPDPVPKSVLFEIFEQARRAPSWSNTQPWEFAIAGGPKLAEIRRRFLEKPGEDFTPDFTHFPEHSEPYASRSHTAVEQSHAAAGISRENKEQRRWWDRLQLGNFGAPCEIYICIDRSLVLRDGKMSVWPVYDCGMITGNIMLLATSYGLGTIIQARAVVYPGIIREVLGIPDSKMILIGIAVGYPDDDKPVNKFTTAREPTEKLARWYGFE
jgi:nitroreductase